MIRILIVDDHEVVRRGVRALLETQPGFEICGESGDGRTAVEQARTLRPDVLVMDASLPSLNGTEATRQIIRQGFCKNVLILTLHDAEEMIRRALRAGARGYVLKTDGGRNLIDAVLALWEGRSFFSPRLSEVAERCLLEPQAARPRKLPARRELTPREREVLQLLAEGCMNKQVAERLGISIKTAETHRSRIMRKLRIVSTADLVRYAVRNKIIEP